MKQATTSPSNSRGFTLVELMIVIAIMLVMVGVAIPTIRLLTKGDKVREATREINLFIESARADAVNRGFGGIWIVRSENNFNKSTRIFKVKRSQRYSGDFENVKAFIVPSLDGSLLNVYLVESENVLCRLPGGIQKNDRIQFNERGPWFTIVGDPALEVGHPVRKDPQGEPVPSCCLQVHTNGYRSPLKGETSFCVDRFPVISSRDSVQLPKGTFINLAHSGFAAEMDGSGVYAGGDDFLSADQSGILISFREDGSLDRVVEEGLPTYPASSVYLFVNAESEDLQSDPLDDLDNQWISILRTTGMSSTADAETPGNSTNAADRRVNSRRGIRLGQTKNAN
ncbi:MAG: prepilin-type N-terminal cleavage/methylation domain-containing protein [Planctomycetota bacterium]|jgi:prepilin-type N-terminal cleavage/methylation domain-containing protein|nr:prepilin-type N-terminal cleavage/methylation domain-containing protein [Planctomycetota bacterium]